MEKIVPAPWDLIGNGYIMLFKFPKQFILEHGFLEERFKDGFFGKVGCIMLADYQDSNVGPYQELLFIPGKLRYQRRKSYTISKIFVSTMASVENGRKNWGIPKELASFSITREGEELDNIKVTKDGVPLIDITLKIGSGLAFPLNSGLLPVPLVQHLNGKTFRVHFRGHGTGKFGQILKIDVNRDLFPNFAFFKHVAIMKVSNFKVRFPAAKIKEEQ